MPITYIVAIDKNDDGDFTDVNKDITPDVLALHWRLGMTQVYASMAAISIAEITVRNANQAYSPEVTPLLPGLYARLAAPKYYAVLRAENHFGWTNLACLGRTTTECAARGNPHEIVALTRAFLDRHARGLPAKRLNKKGDLATYRAKLR